MQVRVSHAITRLALATVTLWLTACDSPQQEKMQAGGVDFCVPKKNRLVFNIWWIPKKLPEGGFSFALPVALENGAHAEIMGGVSEANVYPRQIGKPAPDTQWWKELSIREGRRLVANGRYIASASQSNYSYLVWSPGQEPVSLDNEYTDKSEVIANCLVPKPNDKKGVTCDRVMHLNAIAVHYTFDATLLDKIDLLDKRVSGAINSWRCPSDKSPRRAQ